MTDNRMIIFNKETYEYVQKYLEDKPVDANIYHMLYRTEFEDLPIAPPSNWKEQEEKYKLQILRLNRELTRYRCHLEIFLIKEQIRLIEKYEPSKEQRKKELEFYNEKLKYTEESLTRYEELLK